MPNEPLHRPEVRITDFWARGGNLEEMIDGASTEGTVLQAIAHAVLMLAEQVHYLDETVNEIGKTLSYGK